MLGKLRKDLKEIADPDKAKFAQRFFKTGKGQYAEGDIFIGLTVPASRKIANKYKNLPYGAVKKLLTSKIHEERLIALLILIYNFETGTEAVKKTIYDFYLASTKNISNWDLVDVSAYKIVGEWLFELDKNILFKLAESKSLWERRIAIIATFAFIKRGEYKITFELAEILISDKTDLIQKAVGWMLREVGNRCSQEIEERFLVRNYKKMGRTCLRYAIEKFPEAKRMAYLKGRI